MDAQTQQKRLLRALAEHIRLRRKTLGLTQEQLAEIAGVSTNYIARLEIAANTPSMGTLMKLSKALKASVSELLAMGHQPTTSCEVCVSAAALLTPLSDREAEYVLTQLRSAVEFVLALRTNKEE